MRQEGIKLFVVISALSVTGLPIAALAETISSDLIVVADNLSPQERLVRKVELTGSALDLAIEKAELMKASLEGLSFEQGSLEDSIKSGHLQSVLEYIAFYENQKAELAKATSSEEIDILLQRIIDYREQIYAPSAKAVLEFVLVFSYGPSVLKTAQERYASIEADVKRLSELNLIEAEQFAATLQYCQQTLAETLALQTQAKELLLQPYQTTSTAVIISTLPSAPISEVVTSTDTPQSAPPIVVPEPKGLVEESLNKIKGLYTTFIETGQKVKEALGI